MSNIFIQNPDQIVSMTTVRKLAKREGDRIALSFSQNIFRPAGGGQPHDLGRVTIGSTCANVFNVEKADGETWVMVDLATLADIEIGEMAFLEIDADRRSALSKSHSLTHLIMAAARHVLGDFDSKGASIGDDGNSVSVKFRTNVALSDGLASIIDCLTRHFVLRNSPIRSESAKSVTDAALRFKHWRIDSDLGLSGKIRIVNIEGIDANPCSGSHAKFTGEIGPFVFGAWSQSADMFVQLTACRTPTWMYWFRDGFLLDCPQVDLKAFD